MVGGIVDISICCTLTFFKFFIYVLKIQFSQVTLKSDANLLSIAIFLKMVTAFSLVVLVVPRWVPS